MEGLKLNKWLKVPKTSIFRLILSPFLQTTKCLWVISHILYLGCNRDVRYLYSSNLRVSKKSLYLRLFHVRILAYWLIDWFQFLEIGSFYAALVVLELSMPGLHSFLRPSLDMRKWTGIIPPENRRKCQKRLTRTQCCNARRRSWSRLN